MLARDYWRREAGGLIGWIVALVVIILPSVALYQVMMNSDNMRELTRLIDSLPPPIRAMLGGDAGLTTMSGWLQATVFSLMLPLMALIYAALSSVSILTREMDRRTMDFLLALPIRRSQVILHRFGVQALNLAFMHAVALLAVGVGVGLIDQVPQWQSYSIAMANSYLMALAALALLVCITVFLDEYSRALMTTLGVAMAIYFLPIVLDQKSPVAFVTNLSLVAYYNPREVLTNGAVPSQDLLILGLLTIFFVWLSVRLFDRKQLTA
jgi:ABC-2 type transport system permease protein